MRFFINPHGKLFALNDTTVRGSSRKVKRAKGLFQGVTTYLDPASKMVGPCLVSRKYLDDHMEEISKDEAIDLDQILCPTIHLMLINS